MWSIVQLKLPGTKKKTAVKGKKTSKSKKALAEEEEVEAFRGASLFRYTRLTITILTQRVVSEYAPHVVKNFVFRGTYLPVSHRRMARMVQDYMMESGVMHLSIALQAFILNTQKIGWTTKCHLHTILDNKVDNDIKNQTTENSFQVTGVPFEAVTESRVPTYLGAMLSKTKGAAVPKWSDPSFDYPPVLRRQAKLGIMELLEFYILDPVTQVYRLHCGCDLENVLLDFQYWKACRPLKSLTTGATELLGNPIEPRVRYHFQEILMEDHGVRVLDRYLYTLAGVRRDEVGHLPDHTKKSFRESILHALKCSSCGKIECREHEVVAPVPNSEDSDASGEDEDEEQEQDEVESGGDDKPEDEGGNTTSESNDGDEVDTELNTLRRMMELLQEKKQRRVGMGGGKSGPKRRLNDEDAPPKSSKRRRAESDA